MRPWARAEEPTRALQAEPPTPPSQRAVVAGIQLKALEVYS